MTPELVKGPQSEIAMLLLTPQLTQLSDKRPSPERLKGGQIAAQHSRQVENDPSRNRVTESLSQPAHGKMPTRVLA